jgi:hypothetical protein
MLCILLDCRALATDDAAASIPSFSFLVEPIDKGGGLSLDASWILEVPVARRSVGGDDRFDFFRCPVSESNETTASGSLRAETLSIV